MKRWLAEINFDTGNNWNPLCHCCWIKCPLACINPVSKICYYKEIYDKDNVVACPVRLYFRMFMEGD